MTQSIAPADLDALLTPEEFMAWAQLTRRQVIEGARTGRIPAVKLGGEWRFHPRTVLERLTEQTGAR